MKSNKLRHDTGSLSQYQKDLSSIYQHIKSYIDIRSDINSTYDEEIYKPFNEKYELFDRGCKVLESVHHLLHDPIQSYYDSQKVICDLQSDASKVTREKLEETYKKIRESLIKLESLNSIKEPFAAFATSRKEQIDTLKHEITNISLPGESIHSVKMAMDVMNKRYNRIVEYILPIFKDSENSTLDQLKAHLKYHSNQIIEPLRSKLAQEGSKKLQEICDTRPENIDEYNEKCEKGFHERYYISVFPAENDRGEIIENTWDIYTGIHGYEKTASCYLAQLIFEDGKIEKAAFIEKFSYRRRPLHDSYSEEKWPRGGGGFDEEVEYKGTKSQNYDKILLNNINYTLEHLEKEGLLPGLKSNFGSEQLKIISDNVIDSRSQEIMDYFIDEKDKEGEESKEDKKVICPPESKGFQAMVKASLVWGKFYFAEHHYTNTEVKNLVLEKKFKEEGKEIFYYITFNLGNKEK